MSAYTMKDGTWWAHQFDGTVESGDAIQAWVGERKITWTRLTDVMALVNVAGDAGRIYPGFWVLTNENRELIVLPPGAFQALFEAVVP